MEDKERAISFFFFHRLMAMIPRLLHHGHLAFNKMCTRFFGLLVITIPFALTRALVAVKLY